MKENEMQKIRSMKPGLNLTRATQDKLYWLNVSFYDNGLIL